MAHDTEQTTHKKKIQKDNQNNFEYEKNNLHYLLIYLCKWMCFPYKA